MNSQTVSHRFTPNSLRLIGILLGLLPMIAVAGEIAVILINHIATDYGSFFFCIPVMLGAAGLFFWIFRYKIPPPSAKQQSQASTLVIPTPPVPEAPLAPQDSMPPAPKNLSNSLGFPLDEQARPFEEFTTQELNIQEIPTLAPVCQSVSVLRIQEFIFPKEGRRRKNSQDKLAYRCQGEQCRLAVADGVGSSFLPNEWAQILTNNFVTREEDFKGSEDFVPWLIDCSQQWYTWVDEQWIPIVQQRLNQYIDWSRDRAKGAQATFIGCSFSTATLVQSKQVEVHVMSVGDAVLFHLRPPQHTQETWGIWLYPPMTPSDFGPIPLTLATRSDLIEQAWPIQQAIFTAGRGDIILLTTDALAKWILTEAHSQPELQSQLESSPVVKLWGELLNMSDQANFENFVIRERDNGMLELDDIALLIIYL